MNQLQYTCLARWGARGERVAGAGLLMLATRDPFDISNPVHRASGDAIQRALEPIQSMVPQEHAVRQPMAGFSSS